MPHDPRKYLHDMLDSARFLQSFTEGRRLEDLQGDRGFRSAVERELQIIGEACFALERVAPEIVGGISEYKRIIRLRHLLVHGYDVIDPEIIWEIVTNKIPILVIGIEALTKESEGAS